MKRRSAFLLFLWATYPFGIACAQMPETVTLEEVLRIVEQSPRISVSLREADIARAERAAAGALPNPSVTVGRFTPSGGERTIFDASSQQSASVELPVPIFGQRGARIRAADLALGRAQSQVRLTVAETRRLAALAFGRLLTAGEQLAARRIGRVSMEAVAQGFRQRVEWLSHGLPRSCARAGRRGPG